MNNIGFFNETNTSYEEYNDIINFVNFIVKHENLDNLEFNIIIVDNPKIHEINKCYRHIDRPTDVITFALEDNKDFPSLKRRVLGDIYISVDKVISQSKEYNHSFKRELYFLITHGFLHLLGYDHMNEHDEKIMFKKQEDILNEYGITR